MEKGRSIQHLAHRIHTTPYTKGEEHRYFTHAVTKGGMGFDTESISHHLGCKNGRTDSTLKHRIGGIIKLLLKLFQFFFTLNIWGLGKEEFRME